MAGEFLFEQYEKLEKINKELLEALKEIAKGEGAYSRDRLEHAANTVKNMKELADQAIAKAEGEK